MDTYLRKPDSGMHHCSEADTLTAFARGAAYKAEDCDPTLGSDPADGAKRGVSRRSCEDGGPGEHTFICFSSSALSTCFSGGAAAGAAEGMSRHFSNRSWRTERAAKSSVVAAYCPHYARSPT